MALAKIVVDGIVTKAPEKRFTQNNLPITSFTININQNDETLVRAFIMGNAAETVAETIGTGDRVLVEGRPQIEILKTEDSKEKRVVEINASLVEKIGTVTSVASATAAQSAPAAKPQPAAEPKPAAPTKEKEEIVQFADEEIVEDLIDEDEIPF